MTQVPDSTFFAHVLITDAVGRSTSDPNPLVWTVDPPEAASVAADANHGDDTAYAQVSVTGPDSGGAQASFVLYVTDNAGLSGSSDQLDPTPGAPANMLVEISPD